MRPQSSVKIRIRHTVIGDAQPLICLPLVASHTAELLDQAVEFARFNPDLFEWRIDAFDDVSDTMASLKALTQLRSAVGDRPLIFTCRRAEEGGQTKMALQKRLDLIVAAIDSRQIDIVDVELSNDRQFLTTVRSAAVDAGVKWIASYHNFRETPQEPVLLDTLSRSRDLGADIAKLAVMPGDHNDVLTLLRATLRGRAEFLPGPIITMAMGRLGAMTRVVGGLFGSDITFAAGRRASAPGQIGIEALRQAMAVIY